MKTTAFVAAVNRWNNNASEDLREVKLGVAAVVPLNYKEDRLEHSILYVSKEWSELEDLLTDPASWFYRTKAEQFPDSPVEWILQSPTTLIMEPIGPPFDKLVRDVLSIATLATAEAGGTHMFNVDTLALGIDINALQTISTYQQATTVVRSVLRTEATPGVFIAEFAANTHALNIRYVLPDIAGAARLSDRVPITQCILGMETEHCGTLHFDLDVCEADRPSMRAKLIMDFIEDRERIVRTLNDPPQDFIKFEVGFLKPRMAFPTLNAQPQKRPDKIFKVLDPKSPPRIFIDGMSVATTIPCCPVSVVALADAYYIGGLECKNYTKDD